MTTATCRIAFIVPVYIYLSIYLTSRQWLCLNLLNSQSEHAADEQREQQQQNELEYYQQQRLQHHLLHVRQFRDPWADYYENLEREQQEQEQQRQQQEREREREREREQERERERSESSSTITARTMEMRLLMNMPLSGIMTKHATHPPLLLLLHLSPTMPLPTKSLHPKMRIAMSCTLTIRQNTPQSQPPLPRPRTRPRPRPRPRHIILCIVRQ